MNGLCSPFLKDVRFSPHIRRILRIFVKSFKDKSLTDDMIKTLELALPPEVAFDEATFESHVRQTCACTKIPPLHIRKLRRSIDARSRQIRVNVSAEVYLNESPPPLISYRKDYADVSQAPPAVVVGAGPAGLFAAIRLLELGMRPVVLERGKDVRTRRRDLAAINKEHIVNPDSNYCFGEGGAGTYSDGKLYTRSGKRGDVRRILEMLVAHGAPKIFCRRAPAHRNQQIAADRNRAA
jgi:uncharacterized FAD-dependent dehydrogenase